MRFYRWPIMSRSERYPICPLCNHPVELGSSLIDDDGKVVHDGCLVGRVKERSPKASNKGKLRPREKELSATRDLDYSAILSEYERESLAAEAILKARREKKRLASSPKL